MKIFKILLFIVFELSTAIPAWQPTCDTKVIISHMGYESYRDGRKIIKPAYVDHRLAKWGKHDRKNFGTTPSHKVTEDQIWNLDCRSSTSKHTPEGHFYIMHSKYYPARLAKWDDGNKDIGTYDGKFWPDQMWNIIEVNTGSEYGYKICNYKYSDHCLAKWGAGDNEVGTWINAKDVWSVEPLYSENSLKKRWERIYEIDNTNGKRSFTKTVTYFPGVSTSFELTEELTNEITAEFEAAGIGTLSTSLMHAIKTSTTNTRSHKTVEEKEYTILAGEKWWLCQETVTLDSWRGQLRWQSNQLKVKSDDC